MLKRIKHIFFFTAIIAAFASCNKKAELPDLRETYGYKDTKPFGGYVAYNLLRASYPSKAITIVKHDFADNYNWDYDTRSVYFNVSRNFFITPRDITSILDFVYKGNTAFISAANIDSVLLAKIYCKQSPPMSTNMMLMAGFRKTGVNFAEAVTPGEPSYNYFYFPFASSFTEVNDTYARVIGYNDSKQPNAFVFFWGKGRLYLHTEPRAFSNYFLLSKDNYKYMQAMLSALPEDPQNIYWDDVYSKRNYRRDDGNDDNFSTFGEIMKHPPLKAAFWIVLALLLLYIFFNSKRRQRIVPVVKKPENTSIAFAEAIAGLYLNEKDNKLIAEKMITYFNEFLRTKYFITGNIHDPSYADLLSRKTGVPQETTAALTDAIVNIGASIKVSDQQLLTLNGLIEKFYKNKV